ncbi:NUDIX hydrolase 2-like protein isoform X1 [Tanacetum coccineum]|uniref:NUDIX hydrolase 2-like protein isoform X1 n=1 Tax=Tanacetum coccineum TaxID=301880 RepID=A0ABQ5DZ44_9ASTR
MDQLTNKNGVEKVQLLPAIDDNYGGVEVELKERMDSDVFLARLKASMLEWTLQGKRGVWIKLPIDLVNLVESTVKMLVVQEKNGILRGSGIWKIPTGIVEEAEEISEGAVREVKEETGIDAEFVEILAFRQWHKAFFRKSDLFFVCMMRPSSFDIQIQESEIEAAKWIPLEEFAAQPSAQKQGSLMRYIYDLQSSVPERKLMHPVAIFHIMQFHTRLPAFGTSLTFAQEDETEGV